MSVSSLSDGDLSNSARMFSATLGALITSLVVTPFDVVKTRLQAQIHTAPNHKPSVYTNCSHYQLQTGLVDVWCHKCDFQASPPANLMNEKAQIKFNNSVDAFIKLVRHEGVKSLWRGLSPTLIHSIPSTVIYFWGYDSLKLHLINHFNSRQNQSIKAEKLIKLAPLISGVCARAIATIIVSPIELVKTKSQSLNRSVSSMSIVRAELAKGGLRSLWRGAGPTLWRDVPFSAIYWSTYETIKPLILFHEQQDQQQQPLEHSKLMWGSFVAGASSGMLAAAITHPFDLVKTRRQIEMYSLHACESPPAAASTAISNIDAHHSHNSGYKPPSTTLQVFRTIINEEGWMGLSAGLAARMGKIAPACAIMISTYELAKAKFGKH
jgi:solute carrier family 25 protein 39/40